MEDQEKNVLEKLNSTLEGIKIALVVIAGLMVLQFWGCGIKSDEAEKLGSINYNLSEISRKMSKSETQDYDTRPGNELRKIRIVLEHICKRYRDGYGCSNY